MAETHDKMGEQSWLSQSLYPFRGEYFDSEDGLMHYVDEGTGDPILLVHGTPTWSFLYRNQIAHLSQEYRVIAVDHLGFGLSEKPEDAPYGPEDHARRLTAFVDSIGLKSFSLGVHDFGGPIGLSYAIHNPDTVNRLILFNTWLWSLKQDRLMRWTGRVMRGFLGRLFYRRFNGSPRFMLKAAWGSETGLTDEVHSHYTAPFKSSKDRTAPWVLAQALIGSTEWYESQWAHISQITDKPTLVIWGLNDPTFDESYLARWERTLSLETIHRLPDIGHFVPDEAPEQVNAKITAFLERT